MMVLNVKVMEDVSFPINTATLQVGITQSSEEDEKNT